MQVFRFLLGEFRVFLFFVAHFLLTLSRLLLLLREFFSGLMLGEQLLLILHCHLIHLFLLLLKQELQLLGTYVKVLQLRIQALLSLITQVKFHQLVCLLLLLKNKAAYGHMGSLLGKGGPTRCEIALILPLLVNLIDCCE